MSYRIKAMDNIALKERLQKCFDKLDHYNEGEILDCMLEELKEGNVDAVELARYFVEDTTEEGDDYLTDYQCIEVVVGTYELDWRTDGA